jgi:hypothetical protein
MSVRPKSVSFIAGIAILQGCLAIARVGGTAVAPGWSADGVGRYVYVALAALSIVLGLGLLLRDDGARVAFLWLQGLVFLSSIVTVSFLIHRGTVPGAWMLARILWTFFFGGAALWILSGPSAMAYFGAGLSGHGHGQGHDRAHAPH